MIQARTIRQVSRYFGVIQHGCKAPGRRKLGPDRGPLIVADEIPTTSSFPTLMTTAKKKPRFSFQTPPFFSRARVAQDEERMMMI